MGACPRKRIYLGEIAGVCISAFFKRELGALRDCITEDFEWHFALGPDAPHGRLYKGIAGIEQGFAERDRLMRDVRYNDVETELAGDRALMEYRVTGTFLDGGPFNLRGVEVLSFRDGRLAKKDVYWKQFRQL
jgi:ketosteroid isomerase-like protein